MIETERLILRNWRESDIAPFHLMCNDAEVMRFLGPPISITDAEATLARMNGFVASHGFCFWAIERKTDGAFLGFCGLKPGPAETPLHEGVEIGWRLAREHWGKGYAREAAQASLDWGWVHTDAPDIAAITVIGNIGSWGLMERLGMVRMVNEDFNHPALHEDDPLRRHIVYRITRPE